MEHNSVIPITGAYINNTKLIMLASNAPPIPQKAARRTLRMDMRVLLTLRPPPLTPTDLLDVTTEVAKELVRLPESFHRDPADRLIVATARALDLAVLTHDSTIRRSGLVRIWRP